MFLWRWQWQTWCTFFFFSFERELCFFFFCFSVLFFFFFFKVQIQREPWEAVRSRFSKPCGWTAVQTVPCIFGTDRFLSIKEPWLWEVHGFSGRTVRSGPGFKTLPLSTSVYFLVYVQTKHWGDIFLMTSQLMFYLKITHMQSYT